jgi:hypothetical protein
MYDSKAGMRQIHLRVWRDMCYILRRLELGLLVVNRPESGQKWRRFFTPAL